MSYRPTANGYGEFSSVSHLLLYFTFSSDSFNVLTILLERHPSAIILCIFIKGTAGNYDLRERALIRQFARLEVTCVYMVFTRNQITRFTTIYVSRADAASPRALSTMCKSRGVRRDESEQKCRSARSTQHLGAGIETGIISLSLNFNLTDAYRK